MVWKDESEMIFLILVFSVILVCTFIVAMNALEESIKDFNVISYLSDNDSRNIDKK